MFLDVAGSGCKLPERVCQPLLQLGRCLARKGDGDDGRKLERCARVPARGQQLHDTFDDHAGFAAAGIGADGQVAGSVESMPLASVKALEVFGESHGVSAVRAAGINPELRRNQ